MKSIFSYLFLCMWFLAPVGLDGLSAADKQMKTDPERELRTQSQQLNGNGGEGEGEGESDKKKTKEREQQEKARLAKTEESSFGMLKDLFQSTFDYFYAPDSTKSEEIVRQKE